MNVFLLHLGTIDIHLRDIAVKQQLAVTRIRIIALLGLHNFENRLMGIH